MFIILTCCNIKVRINANYIIEYEKTYDNDLKQYVTSVYTDGCNERYSLFFVDETPEQIDKLLEECYFYVKGAK